VCKERSLYAYWRRIYKTKGELEKNLRKRDEFWSATADSPLPANKIPGGVGRLPVSRRTRNPRATSELNVESVFSSCVNRFYAECNRETREGKLCLSLSIPKATCGPMILSAFIRFRSSLYISSIQERNVVHLIATRIVLEILPSTKHIGVCCMTETCFVTQYARTQAVSTLMKHDENMKYED